jgi:hypothetical protein
MRGAKRGESANGRAEKREKKGAGKIAGRALLGPALAAVALALSIALLMPGGIVQGLYGKDVSFLLFPAVSALVLVLITDIVGAVFVGPLVPRLRGALYILAAGIFLCFLLLTPPIPLTIQPAAFPTLLLFTIAACYVLASHLTKRIPVMRAVARSVTLALAGPAVWWLLSPVQPPWRGIPLPVVFLSGFAFSAAVSLVSLLAYSKNPYLSVLGRWVGRGAVHAFFLGAFLTLYFTWLRLPASALLGAWLLLIEWVAVCLIASLGFWLLRGAAGRTSKPFSYGALAKHLQVVEVKEEKEVVGTAELVRDFVERGSKAGILVHIVSAASASGAPRERVARAVEELADHEDAPLPGIAFRWEVERLARANREARRRVLEKTIGEIERL